MDVNSSKASSVEVVRYRAGAPGYLDVANYDQRRYKGASNTYKKEVMASAIRHLLGPVRGKRLLDVACGTGRGLEELGQEAGEMISLDASLDMLSQARPKANHQSNCAFVAAYAQHIPFPDGYFDVVISLNFLHLFSVPAQKEMVAEMKRVLKPGGILLLEFDNALHGFGIGLYKRWFRDERGSLPWEIADVIGGTSKIQGIHGAVFPIIWRALYRIPTLAKRLEKVAYYPPFNRLSHRIYYKVSITTCN